VLNLHMSSAHVKYSTLFLFFVLFVFFVVNLFLATSQRCVKSLAKSVKIKKDCFIQRIIISLRANKFKRKPPKLKKILTILFALTLTVVSYGQEILIDGIAAKVNSQSVLIRKQVRWKQTKKRDAKPL
jgi:hypothetical protein